MTNPMKMEQTLHEIINSLTTINSSLQLIQKQHPEVSDFLFWEDVLLDVRELSDMVSSLTNANQSGKSDLTYEES